MRDGPVGEVYRCTNLIQRWFLCLFDYHYWQLLFFVLGLMCLTYEYEEAGDRHVSQDVRKKYD